MRTLLAPRGCSADASNAAELNSRTANARLSCLRLLMRLSSCVHSTIQIWRLLQGMLIPGQVLGQGSFGVAMRCYSPMFGELVAKIMHVSFATLQSMSPLTRSVEGSKAGSKVHGEHADASTLCFACPIRTLTLQMGLACEYRLKHSPGAEFKAP